MTVRRLGQDGRNIARPGLIHVELKGLPGCPAFVGAALSDSVKGAWIYRGDAKAAIPNVPDSEPLYWEINADLSSADIFFSPYRDTGRETYTLRLVLADGGHVLVRFAGGKSDLTRLAPLPAPGRIRRDRVMIFRPWSIGMVP